MNCGFGLCNTLISPMGEGRERKVFKAKCLRFNKKEVSFARAFTNILDGKILK